MIGNVCEWSPMDDRFCHAQDGIFTYVCANEITTIARVEETRGGSYGQQCIQFFQAPLALTYFKSILFLFLEYIISITMLKEIAVYKSICVMFQLMIRFVEFILRNLQQLLV